MPRPYDYLSSEHMRSYPCLSCTSRTLGPSPTSADGWTACRWRWSLTAHAPLFSLEHLAARLDDSLGLLRRGSRLRPVAN